MALDKDTGNSLFGRFKSKGQNSPDSMTPNIEPEKPKEIADQQPKGTIQQTAAKWQNLDKVTVLLTTEQKEGLDKLSKKVMKHRSKAGLDREERERITANTILRALIDNFLERASMLPENIIKNEEDVKEWLSTLFK